MLNNILLRVSLYIQLPNHINIIFLGIRYEYQDHLYMAILSSMFFHVIVSINEYYV